MGPRRAGRRFSPDRLRLALVVVGLVVAWLGMGYRLVQVQVVQAAELRERGLDQRLVERELTPDRGRIYDRNGDLLAMTVEAETIYAVPALVTEPMFIAQQVGGLVGADPERLLAELESDKDFVYLKRQVDHETVEKIRQLELPGVFFEPEMTRTYPATSVAAHVV
ncbi:MAG TPA: hypothetical protein VK088_03715, partial [Acidimicrobiia bacterium]|nr:hypothetical protein [Acidimicrobiia bacterium]